MPSVAVFKSALVTTAGAYVTNDCVGGKITLPNAVRNAGDGLMFRSIGIGILSAVTPNFDLFFFDADPSASTLTDKTAFAVAAADVPKIIGIVQTTGTNVVTASARAYAFLNVVNGLPLLPATTTLYAALVSRSSVTFGSVADVKLALSFER